jgi:hypothetical protein
LRRSPRTVARHQPVSAKVSPAKFRRFGDEVLELAGPKNFAGETFRFSGGGRAWQRVGNAAAFGRLREAPRWMNLEKTSPGGRRSALTDRRMSSVSVTAALEGGEIRAFARGESTALEGGRPGLPRLSSARRENAWRICRNYVPSFACKTNGAKKAYIPFGIRRFCAICFVHETWPTIPTKTSINI